MKILVEVHKQFKLPINRHWDPPNIQKIIRLECYRKRHNMVCSSRTFVISLCPLTSSKRLLVDWERPLQPIITLLAACLSGMTTRIASPPKLAQFRVVLGTHMTSRVYNPISLFIIRTCSKNDLVVKNILNKPLSLRFGWVPNIDCRFYS